MKRSRSVRSESGFSLLEVLLALTLSLILFLADSGSRLGEASAVRWADLDLQVRTAFNKEAGDGQTPAPEGKKVLPPARPPRKNLPLLLLSPTSM